MFPPGQVRLGLYYPFIQFRSDSWLKLAALYWDGIARIVPPGYALQDSETVQRLQGELGFVTNLAPTGRDTDNVSGEFLDLLNVHGDEISRLYSVRGLARKDAAPMWQSWPPPTETDWQPFQAGPEWQEPVDPSLVPGVDPHLAYIYSSGKKMTASLHNALIEAGLGVEVPAHGLIGLHPKLAFVYMHALANTMATSVMCPLTDDDFDHVAAGCAAERIAETLLGLPGDPAPAGHAIEPIAVEFALLAIESVIPKDVGSIPVQKIIEIRRKYPAELATFQQAMQALSDAIPEAIGSANPEISAMYLNSLYEKTIEPELRRLRECLRRSGVDSVFGAMSIKAQVPQLAASGAAVLGIGAMHLNPLMVGAGAIIMCLIPGFRRQRRTAQRLRADSPAAYLLRLDEQLRPSSLASDMTTKARRFLAA